MRDISQPPAVPLRPLSFDGRLGRQMVELHMWVVREGIRGAAAAALFDGLCQRFVIAGAPLWRAFNAARREAGKPTAAVDLALHLGEVLYGNVGAVHRLDFTVIGPAVMFKCDSGSFMNVPGLAPSLPSSVPGQFTIADLLEFAGVLVQTLVHLPRRFRTYASSTSWRSRSSRM